MKLQRNQAGNKFILISAAKLGGRVTTAEELATAILKHPDAVSFGEVGSPEEFFALKLKDRHARPALLAYAASAETVDPEYGGEVFDLAARAGTRHPYCKQPD